MPLAISIDNMRGEVLRELGFRSRVYPRWVTQNKIKAETAAVQTERLQAILEALEELRLARAFHAAAVAEGFVCSNAMASGSDASLSAWEAWCAPREAPLTTGVHAKSVPPA